MIRKIIMNNLLGKEVFSLLPLYEERYVVIDTETTGLNYKKDDHILELAAIEVVKGKITGKQFHCYFKPRTEINKVAFSKHHMDSNFYEANFENYGVDEKTLLINFLNFVQDSLIVAHNAQFDMNFLNKEIAFRGLKTIEINRFRCTMEIFKRKFTFRNNYSTLSKCAEYFKIFKNESLLHSAIYDALICTKIFIHILQELNSERSLLDQVNTPSNTRNRLKPTISECVVEKKKKPFKEKESVKDKLSNQVSNLFTIHTHDLERLLSLKSKNNSVLDIPSNEINMLLNDSTNGMGAFLSPDLNRIHFENETQTDTINLHQIDFT